MNQIVLNKKGTPRYVWEKQSFRRKSFIVLSVVCFLIFMFYLIFSEIIGQSKTAEISFIQKVATIKIAEEPLPPINKGSNKKGWSLSAKPVCEKGKVFIKYKYKITEDYSGTISTYKYENPLKGILDSSSLSKVNNSNGEYIAKGNFMYLKNLKNRKDVLKQDKEPGFERKQTYLGRLSGVKIVSGGGGECVDRNTYLDCKVNKDDPYCKIPYIQGCTGTGSTSPVCEYAYNDCMARYEKGTALCETNYDHFDCGGRGKNTNACFLYAPYSCDAPPVGGGGDQVPVSPVPIPTIILPPDYSFKLDDTVDIIFTTPDCPSTPPTESKETVEKITCMEDKNCKNKKASLQLCSLICIIK